MFLHNENKNKEDADPNKINIVEVLIEKHRNGPTGVVKLYFDDKKASFLSIDKNISGFEEGASSDF